MDKAYLTMETALSSLLEGAVMPCVLALTFYSVMHIPFDGLTTSLSIVHGMQWMLRWFLKAMMWAMKQLLQEAMPRSTMTQQLFEPFSSTSTAAQQQRGRQRKTRTGLEEKSASRKPLASSTEHQTGESHIPPPATSGPNNSSLCAIAGSMVGDDDKMAETQPAPAVPKEAESPSKTEEPEEQAKLSNAELKKRAKAEKAARRAKAKEGREQGGDEGKAQQQQQQVDGSKKGGGGGGGGKQGKQQGAQKQQAAAQGRASDAPAPVVSESQKKKERLNENTPAMFAHLAWQSHREGVTTAGKDVHAAILALGIQIRDYVICGSSARCAATLLAFKQLIVSYTTPAGTSLARHLTSHLSHQINFLTSCRPLSVSQGNAIRGLKLVISKIGPRVPEADAKSELCGWIDNFITEKITVADQAIANSAAQKVKNGDVILCYAGSNIVRKTLLTAHRQGKKFRVSIIGARPLFEGKHFARSLVEAGIQVEYSLINGITPATKGATKVFLGAHAMTSNGCLYSRVGTSLVAMSAKDRTGGMDIPVIVCCETVKFTDRVSLDSIVVNEIADPDELVTVEKPWQVTVASATTTEASNDTKPKKSKTEAAKTETAQPSTTKPKHPLENWQDITNLQLLNIMHDVTPRQYIDMVITEMGTLPPSAVPTVHRMSTENAEK